MSARLAKLVLLILGWFFAVQSCTIAQKAELLAEGLAGPTDLAWAYEFDEAGELKPLLVIAEGETGKLRNWDPQSGQLGEVPEVWQRDIFPGEIHLSVTTNSQLVTAQSKVQIHTPGERSQLLGFLKSQSLADQAEEPGAKQVTQLAINEHYLFAIYQGRLLRSRTSGKRYNALRPNAENPQVMSDVAISALVMNDQGYLIAATSENDSAKLIFINPHEIKPLTDFKVLGLPRIDALKFGPAPRPVDRLMYALVSSGADNGQPTESGLYRIDSRVPTKGEFQCQAELVVPIEDPVAFDFGPEGCLFVVTGDGKLLRIDGQF